MSKEKNLTFGNRMMIMNTMGPFVNADCHAFIQEPIYEANPFDGDMKLLANRQVIAGPAIDRLHEFEKLGMEPEELKGINHRMSELVVENGDLKRENEILRCKADNSFNFGGVIHSGDHDYIQGFIDDLVKENRGLKANIVKHLKYITERREENEKLRKENGYLGDVLDSNRIRQDAYRKEIMDLKDKVEEITAYCQETNDEAAELHKERDELKKENKRLRDNMERMKKIVGPADFEKEIEDLKSQLKKQTENVQYWNTEAMNHYRKYVYVLDERAALQRKLEEIAKIAKESKND